MKAAREEAARDTIEVIEVAKASLDHGEHLIAIARQKAPRLASIEGCKLSHQQQPCLRLVIVRMTVRMDLDALLVAAHWHTHGQRMRGAREDRDARGRSNKVRIAGGHCART